MLNVGIFIFNDVEVLDFTGPFEVFSVTSELNEYKLFKVFTISETGNSIHSVNGLKILPDYSIINCPSIDVLIIPGGAGTKVECKNRMILDWINTINKHSKITFSVCSGARILGALGLLDNTEYITHHEVISDMKQIAPKAIVNTEKRFIDNGHIMTSAGISAGIDLSLHIVDKLFGRDIRNKTVKYMEYGDWKKL